MAILFPHSNNQTVPVKTFVASWKVWVETFHAGNDFRGFCMARRHAKQGLQASLDQGLAPCFDVMCRLLLPPEYRNTMQASSVFMGANSRWISPCRAISPTGRSVSGATLTEEAVKIFNDCDGQSKGELLEEAGKVARSLVALVER
jgi:hypothetical protein